METWCNEVSMNLNAAKSGILEIETNGVLRRTTIGDTIDGIPVVDKYKYLGVTLTSKLNLEHQLSIINDKARKIFCALYPYFKTGSLRLRRRLYTLYILPHYLYSANTAIILGKGEKLVMKAKIWGKKCLKLGMNVSNRLVYLAIG